MTKRNIFSIALTLALLQCIVFAPYLFFGKTMMSSAKQVPSIYPTGAAGPGPNPLILRLIDAGAPAWQSEPWLEILHRDVFEYHVLPMWDPDDAYGKPFAAGMQSQPFFPPNLIAAIAPSPTTYNWYIVFRLFLAGLFAALYVRLWAGTIPAIGAGIAEAFTGYFMLYYNMPHLSVETLVPALIFTVELLIRRVTPRTVAGLALAIALVHLGGMPESAALALTLAGVYLIFRIAIEYRAWRPIGLRAGGFVFANLLGAAVAAIMLIPFVEYLPDAFDDHQLQNVGGSFAGLGFDGASPQGLLLELMPVALGPPWNDIAAGFKGFTEARGAVGVLPVFFGLVALVILARRLKSWSNRDYVTAFFAIIATFCLAKRFGSPFAQWFGYLPIYRIIGMVKYLEPITAFCIAVLCGFGIAVLLEGRAKLKHVIAAALLVLWAITGFYLNSAAVTIPDATPHLIFLAYAMAVAGTSLAAVFGLCVTSIALPRLRRVLMIGAVAVIAIELPCEGLVPINYIATQPDSALANPYLGAPYTAFLHDRTANDFSRIFAVSGWLFPNWAAASGLHDVRALDGMNVREFMAFVDAFLAPVRPTSDDLFDRFTGTYPVDLTKPLAQRWLALSSIKYIVSPNPIVASLPGNTLSDLWTQNAASIPEDRKQAVRLAQYVINGTDERVLFEHPPYANIVYQATVSRRHPFFVADIALAPDVYEQPTCGAGANFTLTATSAGQRVGQATRYIDPKHRLNERRWIPLALDLQSAVGKSVAIRFTTAPGPTGDLCADWAIWGEPRFTSLSNIRPFKRHNGDTPFVNVYHADAQIQEFSAAMPRVSIFHHVEYESNAAAALQRITAPGFNPRTTAVVTGSAALGALTASAGDSARITDARPDRVTIAADVRSAGLLMLNDTYYRGWKAWVDGVETPIYRTDYLFRGISVMPGRHNIIFAYKSDAVRLGLIISLIGLVVLGTLAVLSDQRWRRLADYFLQRGNKQ